MNMKKGVAIFAIGVLFSMAARADDFWSGRLQYDQGVGAYPEREFSLDLLGSYATRNRHGHSDAFGFGVGANYFWMRYFGVGLDTYADAFRAPYLLNGSVIARYPVKDTAFAPYGFAGFGRQWEYAPQWLGHIGLGVEYRLNARTGIFLDARRVFPDSTEDYALWRFGLRLAF
jgi:hypothetical protein